MILISILLLFYVLRSEALSVPASKSSSTTILYVQPARNHGSRPFLPSSRPSCGATRSRPCAGLGAAFGTLRGLLPSTSSIRLSLLQGTYRVNDDSCWFDVGADIHVEIVSDSGRPNDVTITSTNATATEDRNDDAASSVSNVPLFRIVAADDVGSSVLKLSIRNIHIEKLDRPLFVLVGKKSKKTNSPDTDAAAEEKQFDLSLQFEMEACSVDQIQRPLLVAGTGPFANFSKKHNDDDDDNEYFVLSHLVSSRNSLRLHNVSLTNSYISIPKDDNSPVGPMDRPVPLFGISADHILSVIVDNSMFSNVVSVPAKATPVSDFDPETLGGLRWVVFAEGTKSVPGASTQISVSNVLAKNVMTSVDIMREELGGSGVFWFRSAAPNVSVVLQTSTFAYLVGSAVVFHGLESPNSQAVGVEVWRIYLLENALQTTADASGVLSLQLLGSAGGVLSIAMSESVVMRNRIHEGGAIVAYGAVSPSAKFIVQHSSNRFTENYCDYMCDGTVQIVKTAESSSRSISHMLYFVSETYESNRLLGTYGGGLYVELPDSAAVVIHSMLFVNNSVEEGYGGAAVFAEFDALQLHVVDSSFVANAAEAGGGALFFFHNRRGCDANVLLQRSKFHLNTELFSGSTGTGGAILVSDFRTTPKWLPPAKFTLRVSGTSFTKNSATYGGAMYFRETENFASGSLVEKVLIGDGTTFDGNEARVDGGAIWLETADLLVGGTVKFLDNRAMGGNGGAVGIAKAGEIQFAGGTTMSFNDAGGLGGGLFVDSVKALVVYGSLEISNCVSGRGGGGAFFRNLQVASFAFNTSITGCKTNGFGGGAIVDSGTTLKWLTFPIQTNAATKGGGGIFYAHNYSNPLSVRGNTAPIGANFLTTPRSARLSPHVQNLCYLDHHYSNDTRRPVSNQRYMCFIKSFSFYDAFGTKLGVNTLAEYPVSYTVAFQSSVVKFGWMNQTSGVVTGKSPQLASLPVSVMVTFDGNRQIVSSGVQLLGRVVNNVPFVFLPPTDRKKR